MIEYLVRHHPDQVEVVDRVKRRGAYGLGLWPTHQQWSEVYNEGFWNTGRPVHHDKGRQFWPKLAEAVRILEEGSHVFLEEFLHAPTGGTREHEEGLHLYGMWSVSYIARSPKGAFVKGCWDKAFPKTCALLRRFSAVACEAGRPSSTDLRKCHVPAIQSARFATLQPGTKVVYHTSTTNQRLKVHCGVENPDGVHMRIANETLTWQPGRCYLLDDSFEHYLESQEGQRPRTILELKISHPDLGLEGGVFLDGESALPVSLRSLEL